LPESAQQQVEFISHQGEGAFKNYLAMNLPWEPLSALRSQIENELKIVLKHRGEAHITVITPVEYDQGLKEKLPISAIEQIASKRQLQKMKWQAICIGEWIKDNLKNYYVVVKSDDLTRLRQEIAQEFYRRGGAREKFNPDLFFPHITLGFNQRDLHFEDGIKKDSSTCRWYF